MQDKINKTRVSSESSSLIIHELCATLSSHDNVTGWRRGYAKVVWGLATNKIVSCREK